MKIVRAAVIGDVVGEPGLKTLEEKLPGIIKDNAVDFTVVNGENSAEGFGMTEISFRRIIDCGADVVTTGNHVWEKREFWQILETDDRILRPANYPSDSPGRGWLCLEKAGVSWVIINLQGRELMTPINCPFICFDKIIKSFTNSASKDHNLYTESGGPALPGLFPVIIVDFHAESSREKESLGYHIDGRAALVAGTHTHVQTADGRLLPKGTAYITDLGMTGITDSVIGMDAKICMERMRKQVLYRMEPAALPKDPETDLETLNLPGIAVQGIITEFDADSGKAVSIRRI